MARRGGCRAGPGRPDGPGSGHGFQDFGSQLWGLDFHTRGFQDGNLKIFRMWFSGCGISILGPGFHTGGFTVAFGHGHPLEYCKFIKIPSFSSIQVFEEKNPSCLFIA